jgi:acyl carrier protein
MTRSVNYSETVKQFLIDNFLFGDGGILTDDTPLFEEGIIDSTGVLELVLFLEENFKITINDDEFIQDNFSSLQAIDRFLQSKNSHATY